MKKLFLLFCALFVSVAFQTVHARVLSCPESGFETSYTDALEHCDEVIHCENGTYGCGEWQVP